MVGVALCACFFPFCDVLEFTGCAAKEVVIPVCIGLGLPMYEQWPKEIGQIASGGSVEALVPVRTYSHLHRAQLKRFASDYTISIKYETHN